MHLISFANQAQEQPMPLTMQELVDLIGRHLTSHDLAACVLVTRSWNKFFTLRLWSTVLKPIVHPGEGYRRYNHHSGLCRMVLSDYLLATQQQQEHHQEDEDSHNRPV
ncbi:hypothetical protein BKA57DRAFT_502028 [Linnemannia elongata]|nr:hypothetical protein BKA57DRAFT_502028 [Linnemannia elongata]